MQDLTGPGAKIPPLFFNPLGHPWGPLLVLRNAEFLNRLCEQYLQGHFPPAYQYLSSFCKHLCNAEFHFVLTIPLWYSGFEFCMEMQHYYLGHRCRWWSRIYIFFVCWLWKGQYTPGKIRSVVQECSWAQSWYWIFMLFFYLLGIFFLRLSFVLLYHFLLSFVLVLIIWLDCLLLFY